jgi:zeaxanthin glucosyltransferase
MARIVFLPIAAPGHLHPTFRLAKVLRGRGHDVVYAAFPDAEDLVRAEGFPFVPVFASLFPKGWMARSTARLMELRGPEKWLYLRQLARNSERLNEELLAGAADPLLSELRPDLLLCDEMLSQLRIIAIGSRIPTLVLNTTFPAMRFKPPPPGLANAVRRRASAAVEFVVDGGKTLLGLPSRISSMRTMRGLARRYAYPVPLHPVHPFFLSHPELPELVLFPRELIAPTDADTAGRCHYVGPCIDVDRQEPAFPWEQLEPGRRCVLLSPGTWAFGSPESRKLFELCQQVAALRQDWQFVLSTGSVLPASLGVLPPNLIAVQSAPQLALLRRAAAMVTHGGLNSVKECIYFGVPMVALPQRADQFRVARLLVRQQLGVQGSLRELTAHALLAKLEEVTASPTVRGALKTMSARFVEMNSEAFLADALHAFLSEGGKAPVAAAR